MNRTHTGRSAGHAERSAARVRDPSVPDDIAPPLLVGVEGSRSMKCTLKTIFSSATVIVIAGASVACSPAAVASPSCGGSSAVARVGIARGAVSLSPQPSAGLHAAHLTVAGTDVNGSSLGLTVQLPSGLAGGPVRRGSGTSSPPAGMAFVVSEVDNTFADPCAHTQRSPKVGSTVADLAKALGEIPDTTATDPVQTTIAGHPATYIEIAIPASLPCVPSEFYLWQDSPNGYWWVQGYGETARVWILDVGGKRVTFLAHSYPGLQHRSQGRVREDPQLDRVRRGVLTAVGDRLARSDRARRVGP